MFLIILFSSFVWLPVNLCSEVETNKFVKVLLPCNVTYRLNHGCSEGVTTPTAGLLHCVSLCGQKEDCTGASLDEYGTACFHHQDCNTEPCQEEDTQSYYYVNRGNYCVHGTWDEAFQRCTCVEWASGQRCNVFPRNCPDVYNAGHTDGSVTATINPSQDGKTLYTVLCQMGKSSADTYLLKSQGQMIFNRTWEEYANGFQVDINNFWTGLRVWHALCKTKCTQVNFKALFQGYSGTFRTFKDFMVQDEGSFFRFSFQGSFDGGTGFGDCFSPLIGTPFSTWDKDNDGNNTENCATRAGSGWWYNSGCDNPCHLLGVGHDYWSNTPQHQHLSVVGLDIEELAPLLKDMRAFIKDKH